MPLAGGDGTARSTAGCWRRSRRRCSPTSLTTRPCDGCDGSVANDAGPPGRQRRRRPWPADPYPDPDPERHAFQLRLTVHEQGDTGQHRPLPQDDLPLRRRRQPRRLAAAGRLGLRPGEARHRLRRRDLAAPLRRRRRQRARRDPGDLERRAARAARRRHAGRELQRRPAGDHRPATRSRRTSRSRPGSTTPHESLRVPAIGDVDGDREAEIVATAGEHVYVWALDGDARAARSALDPALSEPCKAGAAAKPCFDAGERAITSREPHQARLLRLAGARRPRRRRRPRHRRHRARPAPLRVLGRRRRRPARLPGEARQRRRRRRRDRHHAGDRRPRRRRRQRPRGRSSPPTR